MRWLTALETSQLAEREPAGLAALTRAVNVLLDMTANARIASRVHEVGAIESNNGVLLLATVEDIGRQHRPSSEGLAVIHSDGAGKCVRALYAEHGKRHRDPSQGPAW